MGVPRQPYEGLHIIHEEAHTNKRFTSCDGRSRCRGCALYRDASRAANVLGPPPSMGGNLELDGGVIVSLRKYGVYSTWNTYLVGRLNVVR